MQASDIVLIEMPQTDGNYKLRPALILKSAPKYNDFLVCRISTQVHQLVPGFDEIVDERSDYFYETGLQKASLIRLFSLAIVSPESILGNIGKIPATLHRELLRRLANFLVS